MKIFKDTVYQDYCAKASFIALMLSCVSVILGMPLVSILTGFIIGTFISLIIWRKQLSSTEYLKNIPMYKKILISSIFTLISSQIGWLALLV